MTSGSKPSPSVEPRASDGPTITFVVGAARSGTTWLARALGADHRVAATYETHLFNAYVGPLLSVWRSHSEALVEQAGVWHRGGRPPVSTIGLPYVIDDDQFTAMLRRFVDDVFASVAADRPDAEVIIEKTPSHSAHVDDIDRLTGGRARFVHIIRNGCDVVESTLSAGEDWAADWAPRDAATAARKWRAGVLGARRAAVFGDRYYELRYEDLVASPVDELTRLMRYIGLDADADDARRALECSDAGLHLGGSARHVFGRSFPAPTGFRRAGGTDRSARTRVITQATVGALLSELGYVDECPTGIIRRRTWLATGAVETGARRVVRLVRRLRTDIGLRR